LLAITQHQAQFTKYGNIPHWHCNNCATATAEAEKSLTFPAVLSLQVAVETYTAGRHQHCLA